jgi:hypothetical protein
VLGQAAEAGLRDLDTSPTPLRGNCVTPIGKLHKYSLAFVRHMSYSATRITGDLMAILRDTPFHEPDATKVTSATPCAQMPGQAGLRANVPALVARCVR